MKNISKRVLFLAIALLLLSSTVIVPQKALADSFTLAGRVAAIPVYDFTGYQVEVDAAGTNNVVATTTLDGGGNYYVSGLGYGTYDLHITPVGGSDLIPYTATIDLYENLTNFNPYMKQAWAPPMAVLSGKMLLNGGAPGSYFTVQNIDGTTSGMKLAENGFTGTANVDPITGYFEAPVPTNFPLKLNSPAYAPQFDSGTSATLARGVAQMSPSIVVQHDVYKIFNLNTNENATNVTVRVQNECGQAILGAEFTAIVTASNMHIAADTTAQVTYRAVQSYVNANGQVSFPLQLTNASGIAYVKYSVGNGTQVAQSSLAFITSSNAAFVIRTNCDTVPPTGTFTGGAVVLKSGKVSGTAGDNFSGVARVELVSGGVTFSSDSGAIVFSCNGAKTSCTWSLSASGLKSGAQILKVTDVAGNTYATSKNYTIL